MGVQSQQVTQNISNRPSHVDTHKLVQKVLGSHRERVYNWNKRNLEISNLLDNIELSNSVGALVNPYNNTFNEENYTEINPSLTDLKERHERNKDIGRFVAITVAGSALLLSAGCANYDIAQVVEVIQHEQQGYHIESEDQITQKINDSTIKLSGFLGGIELDESQTKCTISLYNIVNDVPFLAQYGTSFDFPNIGRGYVAAINDVKEKMGIDNIVVEAYIKDGKWSGTGMYPSNNKDTLPYKRRIVVLREGMNEDRDCYALIGLNLDNNMLEVFISKDANKIPTFDIELNPKVMIEVYYNIIEKNDNMQNELIGYKALK